MAHIASCVANLETGSTTKPSSPAPSMLSTTPPTSSFDKPFTWRMLPTDPKRYQFFPKDKPLPSLRIKKTLDPEAAFEAAMHEKRASGTNLRLRLNQLVPSRRRKISVSELEPMTTVQEVAMDSPTIPGRPPLLERSASAPNNARDARRRGPKLLNEMHMIGGADVSQSVERAYGPNVQQSQPRPRAHNLSRQLSPLVIPVSKPSAPLLQCRTSSAKLRSDTTPPLMSRSARLDMSPLSRTRITPSSSTPDLSYPRSATTEGASATTIPTPISAPSMGSLRSSPIMWDFNSIMSAQSDRGALSATPDGYRKAPVHVHRRGASESSTSIIDRGRSRKRADIRNMSVPLLKNSDSKRAMSSERRAFKELPQGWKPAEAGKNLSASDISTLRKQALEQAERFEVLKVEDVNTLSKELRRLDERTDYLRRNYTSLRAGRRNLQYRICQYLRSPRVAKFINQESMLKQEEAMAELDASIDDWFTKLEQVENRRIRVRQKLLEHVAAAAILSEPNTAATSSKTLQQAIGFQSPTGPKELSTPPPSPSKTSFASRIGNYSPQRVVAEVPSTIFKQHVVEDATEGGTGPRRATSTGTLRRGDVESIRIYAGDDVYALLADVENEISKMGVGDSPEAAPAEAVTAKGILQGAKGEHERQRQRQRSHEKLNGYSQSASGSSASPSPTTRSPVSPRTTPTTTSGACSPSSPAGPSLGSKFSGLMSGMVTSMGRDVKNNTPHPLALVTNDTGRQEGVFLTSAVFKP